jgi:hypothetical protein
MVDFSLSKIRQQKVEQSSLRGQNFFEIGRMLSEGEMLREGASTRVFDEGASTMVYE